jgi:hypothetical protein
MNKLTFFTVKPNQIKYHGEKYFVVDLSREGNKDVLEVTVSNANVCSGKRGNPGIAIINKNTFLSNYFALGIVESCEWNEVYGKLNASVIEITKMFFHELMPEFLSK